MSSNMAATGDPFRRGRGTRALHHQAWTPKHDARDPARRLFGDSWDERRRA
ncbi:MAG: hypothetical protein FWD74_02320 [Actinomycetia bacterium]|nr:hypothetical protein [Actinomycetes bacterium]